MRVSRYLAIAVLGALAGCASSDRAGQNAALRRVSPRLAALRAVMTSPGLVLPTNLDRLAFR